MIFVGIRDDLQVVPTIPDHDGATSRMGDFLPNLLELEKGESILSVVATETYAGHVLFAFENGKAARVPLASYATKNNRRKLIKAYSAQSPAVTVMEPVRLTVFESVVASTVRLTVKLPVLV